MADLTLAVAQSHAEAPHQTGHSIQLNAKRKSLHSIARSFAEILKFDEGQHPRDTAGRFTEAELNEVSGRILQASGGKLAVLDLRPKRSGGVELETIATAPGEHGQGVGTRAMEALTEWADEVGAQIILSPSQKGYQPVERGVKTTSVARLKKFYKRFGFVEPKGRHYDPALSSPLRPVMFRPVKVTKYDPSQPRDEQGQWSKTSGRSFTSDEGYQWHETGPVAEWATHQSHADNQALSDYAGFGYREINNLRRGDYQTRITDHFVRAATPEEMRRVGWDPEKNEWVPSIKVKEGKYKTGYPVDPRDVVTPEHTARFGHPMGKREAKDYDPEDPYHQVEDGRIIVNQYYTPTPGGPKVMFSIRRAGPDIEAQQRVEAKANALDDLIAHRGYELPEAVVVKRGAYLPGVTPEQLSDMIHEGPNGEPPPVWEEKGFTSTFLGEANGRPKSYPALGKWESIMARFGSSTGALAEHEDEVGTAVQFHITLPKGTKVASVEAARRLSYRFPDVPAPVPEKLKDDPFWQTHQYTERDYNGTPVVDASDLKDPSHRSESEVLLGSGARFRVTSVAYGYTYPTGDASLKPVKVYEVHLEYTGGGSSERRRT